MYSLANSTSLASVGSASSAFVWQTGTSTSGAVVSLTQFQGGWSIPKIHPMTFASTSLSAGEYVIGHKIDFAQASSSWTVSLYGAGNFLSNSTTLTAFNSTPTSAGVLSSGGLSAGSFHSATASVAALSNAGTLGVNNVELSSNSFVGTAVSGFTSATAISTKSISVISRTAWSASPTAANALSSGGFAGVSALTASTSAAVISNSGTTSVVPQYMTLPNFNYIGTGSTTSALPSVFIAGIMSTSTIPAAISLTAAGITFSGTAAGVAPYFALVGS
jgi:hypothetical protein